MRQVPAAPYARVMAARGPKMLKLAGEIADGANPNAVPPEYTARARTVLGPDKLLVVGVGGTVTDDPKGAREAMRQNMTGDFTVGMHLRNLEGLGYSEEEIRSGSDRFIDALGAYGGPDDIAKKVKEHLDAGADHVMVMLSGMDYAAGVDHLVQIAPAVTAL
jgi:probable F420-dependent oxidoreductase